MFLEIATITVCFILVLLRPMFSPEFNVCLLSQQDISSYLCPYSGYEYTAMSVDAKPTSLCDVFLPRLCLWWKTTGKHQSDSTQMIS